MLRSEHWNVQSVLSIQVFFNKSQKNVFVNFDADVLSTNITTHKLFSSLWQKTKHQNRKAREKSAYKTVN